MVSPNYVFYDFFVTQDLHLARTCRIGKRILRLIYPWTQALCATGSTTEGLQILVANLLLLLFASTKFCDLGIVTILRVLIFAISWRRAKFCEFTKLNFKIHWRCKFGYL